MKSYHLFMHTTALALSAVLFKAASAVLGRAVHHKHRLDRLRDAERVRSFGYHGSNVIDIKMPRINYGDVAGTAQIYDGIRFEDELLTEDEEDFMREHGYVVANHFATNTIQWTEADPHSDYDPIHPDYYPEK